MRAKDYSHLVGKRFGQRTVTETGLIGFKGEARRRCSYALCVCDCGAEEEVRIDTLLRGRAGSCRACAKRTHNESGGGKSGPRSPEYGSWMSMIARCHTESSPHFPSYGGRGICVCERWRASFEMFLEDMGRRPSPDHSLDRIDNDGNYEPDNCRWATSVQQAGNRRSSRLLTIDGVSLTVADWSRRSGANQSTIHGRLRRGWTEKESVFGR